MNSINLATRGETQQELVEKSVREVLEGLGIIDKLTIYRVITRLNERHLLATLVATEGSNSCGSEKWHPPHQYMLGGRIQRCTGVAFVAAVSTDQHASRRRVVVALVAGATLLFLGGALLRLTPRREA